MPYGFFILYTPCNCLCSLLLSFKSQQFVHQIISFLWHTPFYGYERQLFSGIKRLRRESDPSPHSSAEVKSESVPLVQYVHFSWHAQGQLNLYPRLLSCCFNITINCRQTANFSKLTCLHFFIQQHFEVRLVR
jgi:hypothetical protein